jgi:hypothetical protein
MTSGSTHRPKNVTSEQTRIKTLETDVKTFTPLVQPSIVQELTFQFQGTQFAKVQSVGNARVYPNSAPSSIDEETLAAVAAYATFDDIGGNGTAIEISGGLSISDSFTEASFTALSFGSDFITPDYKIPMLDSSSAAVGSVLTSYTSASYGTTSFSFTSGGGGTQKPAWYRGNHLFLNWSPTVTPLTNVVHTKQFMVGHSFELNVPGTNVDDKNTFAYYDSDAEFNVGNSISMSLWIYPTNWDSINGETFRYLLYRRQDANNYFILNLDALDSTHLVRIFVREGGTETKLKDGTGDHVLLNQWNLINFTYNPGTNALVLYVNGVAYTDATSTVLTPVYSTDSHMYIGGLPALPDIRFTGYMDNFVFWNGKILSTGEVTNMWTRGTII